MIIITRPSPYGGELTQLCNQANLPAKHLPLFKIENGVDIDKIQEQLDLLSPGDIVIITSPQVSHIIQSQNLLLKFPSHVYYFAVGQHSALLFQALSKQIVKYPKENENSEELINYLKALELPVNGHQILLLGGDVGRNVIKSSLKSQGGLVKNSQIYKRQLIHYPNTVLDDCINNNCLENNYLGINRLGSNCIVVTSVEQLLKLASYCNKKHNNQYTLIVSAVRIAQEAKLQGWKQVHLAPNANNQNLFKTITTLCHNTLIK